MRFLYYRQVTTGVLGIKKSVHILKPRNCCRAILSAEDVCRTENFLDRLDNISSSSYGNFIKTPFVKTPFIKTKPSNLKKVETIRF